MFNLAVTVLYVPESGRDCLICANLGSEEKAVPNRALGIDALLQLAVAHLIDGHMCKGPTMIEGHIGRGSAVIEGHVFKGPALRGDLGSQEKALEDSALGIDAVLQLADSRLAKPTHLPHQRHLPTCTSILGDTCLWVGVLTCRCAHLPHQL